MRGVEDPVDVGVDHGGDVLNALLGEELGRGEGKASVVDEDVDGLTELFHNGADGLGDLRVLPDVDGKMMDGAGAGNHLELVAQIFKLL